MKRRKKHGKSILQAPGDKSCYLCAMMGRDYRGYTEKHHIFPGANRIVSEELGFWCRLCVPHHREGPSAAHQNAEIMRYLQQQAQKEFEKTHSREEFVARIGRNYL